MKILLADDHGIVRKGLAQLLREDLSADVEITEVDNAEQLLHQINHQTFDLVISDISMPGRSGLEALEQIRLTHPRLPVLLLSMHPEKQYAVRALKAGASGYLTKESASDELIRAVQTILTGKKYISTSMAESMAEFFVNPSTALELHEQLSNREYEVFRQLASGKTVGDISDNLKLSVNTISTYRTRILEKLKLRNNAELMHYAISRGISL